MALCRITGIVYLPSGEIAARREVTFVKEPDSVTADYLGAVLPEPIRTRTDTDGSIDLTLITGNYYGFILGRGGHNKYTFKAIVPESATADFADLIAAVDPVEPLPSWLQQVIEARDEARASEVAAGVSAGEAADSADLAAAFTAESPQSWAQFADFLDYADGKVVSFNGVQFIRDRSANIAGFGPGAGWKPAGDITALHFGTSVNSESLNNAADYVRSLGGGEIVTKDEWGNNVLSSTVDVAGVSLKGGRFVHGSGDGHLFASVGSVGALGSLIATVGRGTTSIRLSNILGVTAGVTLLITSTDAYATTDAGYRSGEVVEVASVSGDTVTLVKPIQGRIDRSAYAAGDTVRMVNYVKGGVLHDVTVSGDWEAKGAVMFAAYATSPELKRVFVSDHGNLAYRFHTTKNGRVSGGRVKNLRMDLADGRSAYAMALSGSDVGFEMDKVATDTTRHAFTTIGGPDGFPRKFTVKGCTDFNSLSGSFDTHAAGADYEISNCSSFDSAGSAFQCRAPYGVHHGNTAVRPASHGFQCVENVLSDITISAFTLRDGGGNGISCSQACDNLRILDSVLDGMGAYGIRLYNSATRPSFGAVIKGSVVRNWGLTNTGLSGVQVDGTQANTGVLVDSNYFHAGTPGIARAVRMISATGGTVKDNTASGSYSDTVFDIGNNRSLNNVTLGALADQVGPPATDPATTMALVNSLRASLIALGAVRQ